MSKEISEFASIYSGFEGGTFGYIFEEFLYKSELNNEYIGIGLIITNETDLSFNDGEVVDFKWMSPRELKVILNDENMCPALSIAFEKAEEFRNNI